MPKWLILHFFQLLAKKICENLKAVLYCKKNMIPNEKDDFMKNLLVIDGNSILNRQFYGIRPLSTKNGLFTNAVFGI